MKTINEVANALNSNRFEIQAQAQAKFGAHNHENFIAALDEFAPMMITWNVRRESFSIVASSDPDILSVDETLLVSAQTMKQTFALAEYSSDFEALAVFLEAIKWGLRKSVARLGVALDTTVHKAADELVKILGERLAQ